MHIVTPPFKFGFIYFDDINEPSSGTYSIAGGKAQRLELITDIPSDVIWWTNLPYAACNKSALGGMSNIRYNKFLVISPEDCLMEWGYKPKSLKPEQFAVFVSRLFNRIMMISFNLIIEMEPRRNIHEVFSTRELRNDFAAVLPRPVFPSGEAASVIKSGYSYVDFTATTKPLQRGVAAVVMRKPRLSHAIDMLTTLIPNGDMEFISARKMDAPFNHVLESKRPMLSEVVLSQLDPIVAPIFAYGHSMDRNKKIMRSWVAHPELIALSAFSNIEVKGAWQGQEYEILSNTLQDAVKNFLMSPFAPFSWSAGIVAETLWKGCCLKNPFPPPSGEEAPQTSWRGLWVKSSDKTLTFMNALSMSKLGWQAGSYGAGYVRFGCHISQVESLIKDGLALGMVPRLDCIPSDFDAKNVQWKGDKKSEAIAMLSVTKNSTTMLNMDKVMCVPEANRKAVMAEIMQRGK